MIWAKEETMSRAEIEAIQLKRLKETVRRVYEKVEPYRRKMEEARRAKEKAAKLAAQGAQDTAKAVPLPPAEQKDDKK